MKSKFLFPTWCAIVGYLLAIPGFILGYLYTFKGYEIPGFGLKMREKDGLFQKAFENFTNELIIFLVIGGLILIAFSKAKKEDELTAKLRLNSLYWSVMIYYMLYILGYSFIIIGEIPFVEEHLAEMNLFTPLVIFISRFYYLKHVNKDSFQLSKPNFLSNKPFKTIGIILTILGFTVVTISLIIDSNKDWVNIMQTASYLVLVFGLLFWTFSKNKEEDEMTMQQRLEGLQLAVYFNYAVILFLTLITYSLLFLYVLIFAQFSILLFFVIRMEFINYKNNKLINTFEGGDKL